VDEEGIDMKLGDLVEIEWEDHCTDFPGWRDMKEPHENSPALCRTVGYIIAISKKYVTLAPTLQLIGGKYYGNAATRIRSCFIRTKVLKGLK
jgi:hypothetical protein